MIQLAICYTRPGKKPQYVCLLQDAELIRQAAHVAVEQAESRAAAAGKDRVMARLEAAEVQRLRTSLEVLIPGFAAQFQPAAPGVM